METAFNLLFAHDGERKWGTVSRRFVVSDCTKERGSTRLHPAERLCVAAFYRLWEQWTENMRNQQDQQGFERFHAGRRQF